MPRASWNYIGDLPLSIPPEIEQEEIHKLLDTRIISISVIIEDSKYLIQMLKSYRQSLIYEAVSGKIDVRDYQFKRSEQFA